MKKLCVIDMYFCWPPGGGGPADLLPVLTNYSKFYETTLLIPKMTRISKHIGQPWPLSSTKFFSPGSISFSQKHPFQIQTLDFSLSQFTPQNVAQKVQKFVDQLKPDNVIISDSCYFKPQLVFALASYQPVLFLFAHETMCLKGNGILFRKNQVCNIDWLDGTSSSQKTCSRCALSFFLTYPSPRWLFEFFVSKAFTRKFQQDCIQAFGLASAIVVKNKWIASRLKPYAKGSVIPIPPGINVKRFCFHPAVRTTDSSFRFLLTGRMNMKNKGLSVALKAASLLWKERKDFELWVTHSFKTLYPFVHQLPWYPYDEVHKIYQEVDALIFPSLWPEPFGMVAEEALASGVPVIGTQVGGIPEIIQEGITGFLFPPGDVFALKKRMSWCLDHREEIKAMASVCREKAITSFSDEVVFETFYKNLLKDLFPHEFDSNHP